MSGARIAAAALVGLLVGVLATLIVRFPSPRPPEVVLCPPPAPCAACPACPIAPAASGPGRAARAAPPPRSSVRPPEPLPPLPDDPEVHRERLRAWFASQAGGLGGCFADGDGRRRLLVEIALEPDGTVARAALLGATDLPPRIATCLVKTVQSLRAPADILRGRETVVVHVSL